MFIQHGIEPTNKSIFELSRDNFNENLQIFADLLNSILFL